jgi:cobalt/nickel transport system ATP-binding protein
VAPVIRARDLRYTYPDGTPGLDGVDVTVATGERVAVLGSNGSGKSTLQLLLGGLEAPDGGRVTYFGGESDPEAVRDRIAVLTQEPDDYLFNATVREDIEYGPAQLDVPRETARERVESLVDRLGLDGLLDRPPFRLSAGEKARAALAAALAVDPDVLLLDEPTSDLDGPARERVLGLLDDVAADGTALVTFTPGTDLVPRVADRVVVLGPGGTVAARGTTREILTDVELLDRQGLRPPAAVRLFDGLVPDPPLTVADARERLDDLTR